MAPREAPNPREISLAFVIGFLVFLAILIKALSTEASPVSLGAASEPVDNEQAFRVAAAIRA